MKLHLSTHIRVGFDETGLSIGFGSQQFHATHNASQFLELLEFCLLPRRENEIAAMAETVFGKASGRDILSDLKKRHVIVPEIADQDGRYSRPKRFYGMLGIDPELAQTRISASSVVLAGTGGIGNLLALTLATAGVGQITIADGDVIELSNLSRQWAFTEKDVGKTKVSVLKSRIEERNSECVVISHEVFSSKTTAAKFIDHSVSLVIVSADGPGTAHGMTEYCVEQRIPNITVGYVNDIAVWGPFYIPRFSGCYCCLPLATHKAGSPRIESTIKRINERYQVPSCGPINMLASSLAADEILRFLAQDDYQPPSSGKRLGISPSDLAIRSIGTTPLELGCKCIPS